MRFPVRLLYYKIAESLGYMFGVDVQKWTLILFGVIVTSIILYYVYKAIKGGFHEDDEKAKESDVALKESSAKQNEERPHQEEALTKSMSMEEALKLFEEEFGKS